MLDGARLGGILDKCRLLCGGLIPRFRAVVGKGGRSESLDFGHDIPVYEQQTASQECSSVPSMTTVSLPVVG